MAFKREVLSNPHTSIPNETLRDPDISDQALGLLVFMLSLPDDWVYNKEWLRKQRVKRGRDRLDGMLKELEKAGYLTRERVKNKQGKFEHSDWTVRFTKMAPPPVNTSSQPHTEKPYVEPHTEKPCPAKQQLQRKELTKKIDSNNKRKAVALTQVEAIEKMQTKFPDIETDLLELLVDDYFRESNNPSLARLYVVIMNSQRISAATSIRAHNLTQGRDELANATQRVVEAQTASMNSKAVTIEAPQLTTEQRLTDTTWAEKFNFDIDV